MAAKRIQVSEGNCRIKIEMRWAKGRSITLETKPEGIPKDDPAVNTTMLAIWVHGGGAKAPKVSRTELLDRNQDLAIDKLLRLLSDEEYAAIMSREKT